ncbi:MAG: SIS domain-containing protein [Clostridia bacterium]|nr:SIS domain-containing protein [Clostridia bacterium]MBQ9801595.1 SIS domain-containing protein [Clostridia bacterium]
MRTLNAKLEGHISLLLERYPALAPCRDEIVEGYFLLEDCYKRGGKVLIAGNGGSAADAEHIVGELMKGFCNPRPTDAAFAEKLMAADAEMGAVLAANLQGALPAIALDGHFALSTAFINDCDPLMAFAQQVNGYGCEGDLLLGITTSGNSKTVMYAATVARAKGMKVLGLTGERESRLSAFADACVRVPEAKTYMVQELHLPIYHCWCLMIEDAFFGGAL